MNTKFAKLAERIVAVPSMFRLAPRQDARSAGGDLWVFQSLRERKAVAEGRLILPLRNFNRFGSTCDAPIDGASVLNSQTASKTDLHLDGNRNEAS
jgi:hypothetical protein